MQSIYWFCFIVGGVFVAAAAFGDLGDWELDADADADFDVDGEFDPSAEADLGASAEIDTDLALDHQDPIARRSRSPRWLSLGVLTSFKFWTFGGCFFGLTGLLLTWISSGWGSSAILMIALAMGCTLGGSLATTLRVLRRRRVDSLVRTEDFAGLLGIVELPFDANSKGKVCLEVRGSTLHMIAYTDDQTSFVPGDKVLVVGTENNRLWVVKTEDNKII